MPALDLFWIAALFALCIGALGKVSKHQRGEPGAGL